jgi:hypothetical protein
MATVTWIGGQSLHSDPNDATDPANWASGVPPPGRRHNHHRRRQDVRLRQHQHDPHRQHDPGRRYLDTGNRAQFNAQQDVPATAAATR